jgi:hypothetical protein
MIEREQDSNECHLAIGFDELSERVLNMRAPNAPVEIDGLG